MEIKKTKRGKSLIEFKDMYDESCSLQEDSDGSIWLGVDDNRMNLDRDQVKALLPHLQAFVKTGLLKLS